MRRCVSILKNYNRLMKEYGLTQEEAAARVGKSRPAVANALRLLRWIERRLTPKHGGLRGRRGFVARRFRDPVLRQVLGYPAVFLGASPASAPAIYHLMSALDLAEGVQYPMGGFWELVQRLAALAEAEGARITTGADVTAITTSPGPATGSGTSASCSTSGPPKPSVTIARMAQAWHVSRVSATTTTM